MTSSRSQFTSIDEYLGQFPENVRVLLQEIRLLIRDLAPQAEETISYGMPAFKLNGKVLVYFAAFKNHIGFFPTASGIEAFKEELSSYKTSKGTVQFPYDKPIPSGIVSRIVKFRVKEVKSKKKI